MNKKTVRTMFIVLLVITQIVMSIGVGVGEEISNSTEAQEGDYQGFLREIDGSIYYYENGEKVKGIKTIEGSTYYFNQESGLMEKGFKTIDGETYYFRKSSGKMSKGFIKIGDKTYYFGKSTGRMYKGLHKIKKNLYRFNDKGVLVRTIYKNKKAICLTYDDGPAIHTDEIMNILKKYNSSATFFMVGSRIPVYKNIVDKMSKLGFQMANHTYSHPWLANMSSKDIKNQVKKCNENIKKYGNQNASVIRTPGGQINEKIKSNVGMPIILWSIDTRDWATRNATNTYNVVVSNVHDGDIVLMHDLHESTKFASKKIIPKLVKKGFQLITVEEMAMLKGVKLKEGRVYFSFRQ